jgi:hypothetical protein
MLGLPSIGGGHATVAENKSALRAFADKYMGGAMSSASLTKAKIHVIETGQSIRQTSEGAVMGAALGAAHAELGLDHKGIPVDAVIAVVGAVGRGALADQSVGVDIGNIGASAASVFAFRKTYDFVHAKKMAAGQKPAGQVGDSTASKPATPPAGATAAATPAAGEMPEASDTSLGADPVIAMAERLAR